VLSNNPKCNFWKILTVYYLSIYMYVCVCVYARALMLPFMINDPVTVSHNYKFEIS